MKYFKLKCGYNPEDCVEIDETELEKAFYSFLEKKDAVYSGGAVRGSEIMAILPDYHRMMGWNKGHKLGPLDYEELSNKGIDRSCQRILSGTKEKVLGLIQSGQTHLIGKGGVSVLPGASQEPARGKGGMKSTRELLS